MSRSFKKVPRSGDKKSKFFKNYANRKLRRKPISDDEPQLNGKSYRKNFCSYDICDYEDVGSSFEQFYQSMIKHWYEWRWMYEDFPDKEECKKEYNKWYKRK